MSPETGVHHLRNVLQAFVQSAKNIDDLTVFTPSEAAAIVVRIKAALRELEAAASDPRSREAQVREAIATDANAVMFIDRDSRPDAYAVDVVQGARMDGAMLGGQEPEGAS